MNMIQKYCNNRSLRKRASIFDVFDVFNGELNSIFSVSFPVFPFPSSLYDWSPTVDFVEKKDSFVVKVDVPGVEKKDVKVSIKDGVLTVSGEKKSDVDTTDSNCRRLERKFGSFCRSFYLPADIVEDDIDAVYESGTLTVTLKKSKTKEIKTADIKIR